MSVKYHKNQEVKKESNPKMIDIIFGYLSIFFIISIIAHLFIKFYWLEESAYKKAKDEKNIISGCIYITNVFRDKYGGRQYNFSVDGNHLSTTLSNYLKNSPFSYKRRYFYQDIKDKKYPCYPVKYIKVEFLFYKCIFLYDYIKENKG